MGVLRGIRVDFCFKNLVAIVVNHHLNIASAIVDPRKGVVVDCVDACSERSEYSGGNGKLWLWYGC